MLTIAIENHWLTHGERNPLEEEAEVKIGFAGKEFIVRLEAVSLANMGLAESHLTVTIGKTTVTLVDEEIHDQKLTWDCDHPEELNA